MIINEIIDEIEKRDAMLEAVISNYSGIIWNINQDNIITLLNGLYIKKLGLTPASFEGWELGAAQEANGQLKIIANVRKTFVEGPQDWIYEDKGKIFHAHNTPIFDDNGEVSSVVGTIDDITEITRLQTELEEALKEAKKANNAKSDFLAKMSHEMRTPLNAVIGMSGLSLEDDRLDAETRSNIEKTYTAGMTLLNIVNDILDISKIEAGKLGLIEADYDVPSLINDAITQNILSIGEKPIDFVLDISEDLFARLRGDEIRVKQIINNLLSNAIKYTEKGSVELSVRCAREEDIVWLTIQVRDTGKGIRPEDIGSLFFDYSQLELEKNRYVEGTGLGLPITKRLARMMKGEVSVESEYGKGSVFTVRVSQKYVDDTGIGREVVDNLKKFRYTDNKRDRNVKIKRVSLPHARVLVVDDNLTNLDVARGLMKPYGMKIDCLTGGAQAVDAIRKMELIYDAVFMDHMMPEIDGIEALRQIRELGTDYAKDMPVIALTANALAGNEEMFLSKGFQAFLSKPIDLNRLDEIIRRFVYHRAKASPMGDQSGDADSAKPPAYKEIPGLDLKKGVERFGGDAKAYLNSLRSYAVNTLPILDSLSYVSPETLTDYITAVHGVKGSSFGISAGAVGDLADKLERAAKAGDADSVLRDNPALLESIRSLIDDIEKMLGEIDAKLPKPKQCRPDSHLLMRLRSACDDYDIFGADKAIEELDAFEYEIDGEIVDWLKERISRGCFDEIRERLSSLAAGG